MTLPHKPSTRMIQLLELFDRADDWVILINADPDAMASALALKRIMSHRAGKVLISRINDMSRPDNLAMSRYLRIPLIPWSKSLCPYFQRFALVDSQPHHNPAFQDIPFSIVIDHHPLVPEHPVQATYMDIRPKYGATSTLFAEYLRALGIRPGIRLATALQYGIRTDTATFTRKCTDVDIRAYQQLALHADTTILTRITRSEYLPEWLPYFTHAFTSMHACGRGTYAYLGEVKNPDILVVIADFFTRVHGLHWVGICGVCKEQIVVIFRGDGLSVDLGELAATRLGSLGAAGGHRALARAEFPLAAAEGRNVEVFVYRRLCAPPPRKPAPESLETPATTHPE